VEVIGCRFFREGPEVTLDGAPKLDEMRGDQELRDQQDVIINLR